ncbi:HAD hydrolase-like protein [Arcanobacterium hippocoleae]
MKTLKAVLFDLDGTVTDSAEIVSEAMQAMLYSRTGIMRPIDSFYKYLGPPLSESFQDMGAKPEETAAWLEDYRTRYLKKMPLTPLFPGIKELLAQLQSYGFALGVATSKNTKYAKEVCDYTDVSQYFTEIYGASEDDKRSTKALVVESALAGFTQKEILQPEALLSPDGFRDDVVMVGDRIHDIEGAGAHHLRTILVGWGKAPQTERNLAWKVVETPAELQELLFKM